MRPDQTIISLELDESGRPARDAAGDLELASAIRDLCADNRFGVVGDHRGPFSIRLGMADDCLRIEVYGPNGDCLARPAPSLLSLRRLVRDYMSVRGSHLEAMRAGSRSRIEAIDVGRRALHDEGAEALRQLLESTVIVDKATARRLFTLVCALVPPNWSSQEGFRRSRP